MIDHNFRSTNELLRRHVEHYSARIAHSLISFKDGQLECGDMTFGQWSERVDNVVRTFSSVLDAPPRCVVLALDENDLMDAASICLGVHRLGGACAIVSRAMLESEVVRLCRDINADLLVIRKEDTPPSEFSTIVMTSHDFANNSANGSVKFQHSDDSSSIASIVFTSGTTGLPKAVAITHQDLVFEATELGDKNIDVNKEIRVLHGSPLFAADGLAMIIKPLTKGARVFTAVPFRARTWCLAIERFQITDLFLVPTMAFQLLDECRDRCYMLSSVKRVVIGSAAINPNVICSLQDLLPAAEITLDYSCTESGIAGVGGSFDPEHPCSVGRPYLGTKLKIVDQEGQVIDEPEFVGEVWLHNSRVPLRSYWRDDLVTKEVFSDGWVRTGDLGYLDTGGRLYIVGRIKDVINIGGLNVSAREVEAVLEGYQFISLAAVVGIFHPLLGDEIVAAVVPAGEINMQELRAYLVDRLSAYKLPTQIAVVSTLPITENGKIDKARLRDNWDNIIFSSARILPSEELASTLASLVADVSFNTEAFEGENILHLSSLESIRLRARIWENFGVELSVEDIFDASSLCELVEIISRVRRSQYRD